LVRGGYDKQEIETANAHARTEVDVFIAALKLGKDSDYAVKTSIEDRGEVEHFWLTEVLYRDGEFEGFIGNESGLVANVKLGQEWRLKKEQISD